MNLKLEPETVIELKDGHLLEVHRDLMAESPREYDNFGIMLYAHGRYELGDRTFNHYLYSSWGEALVGECGKPKDIIYLPLFLYDHSGITMNTTGFSCPWDSGQVGWIYVTKENVRQEYGVKRITTSLTEKVKTHLQAEVAEFDKYIMGETFYYILKDKSGEEIDSCSGFLGADIFKNGIMDNIPKDFLLEYMVH